MILIVKIFLLATLIAFFNKGLHKTLEPGMIFYFVRSWLDSKITNETLRKPLYSCPACMSSFWGSIIFLLVQFQTCYYCIGAGVIPVFFITLFIAVAISYKVNDWIF